MKVGVLSLQGDVLEHLNQIKHLGHIGVEVKKEKDLNDIDAIILPGGESTTIGKLLKITGLMEPLRNKIRNGLPTWGTCAGMILLADEIEGQEEYLKVMNIKVRRNAFGTQIDSFRVYESISTVSEEKIELVFIRAPYIVDVKETVEVLCKIDNNIVAAREGNIVVTSFHPEVTDDLRFLDYFLTSSCMNYG
ncbi:5'-phosphate synthase pdxT subunit [Clostridium saccharoperbutylacetonicum]|uniref:Pyridoxal 5'-phosphate synthase subunit PdxT n=2 Tax=Clostridium TaxID=1485 RepID=M1N7X9_9CLOT|nr:pyridoxal 5'-phosphate synthase glutaminase subunit PdxT [Clostridium saccharoperbutylacetonicum]AGF59477.1 glutamine amidotransferase subunit PdxT [Clostridium saccharoperbutylacetonicum N1-4(HMT)]NRT59729.1 5'-phosphate synthase pdxT subunit [Clostridium saccharoperbutylacetonicum]NSB28922.1 5'-phosphate synthase pdxT subunit [Clostridium saccharoperbutylacetonicum]NSB42412.1 5'-phosphate synthase pdxT subunit [Clostridium saccharoperbutylacetonicum]